MSEETLLLARQPIYDASLNVVAYELLYRSISPDASHVRDGDEASSRVLLSAFGGVGIMNVTEGKPAFINFTNHLIINPPPLDPDMLIVEILEDVRATDEVVAGVKRLREQGFRIALDDFQHHPDLQPLVELADIIKLDVLQLGEVQLRAEVRNLRNLPLRLLAEKIETWEMYNHCVDLGFSYFQGYFLARPQLVTGRPMTAVQPTLLELMQKLGKEDVTATELANTIATDPILSFSLIKLVNSPLYRSSRPIESLRDAIFQMGINRVRGWCYLLLLSNIGTKPHELTRIAMVRARFCELLAEPCPQLAGPRLFILGMLSSLDAFLDTELAQIAVELGLGEEMRRALLARRGPMGALLKTALAFENGDWERVPWDDLAALGITREATEHAYLTSLQWVAEIMQAIKS